MALLSRVFGVARARSGGRAVTGPAASDRMLRGHAAFLPKKKEEGRLREKGYKSEGSREAPSDLGACS